MSGFNPDLLIAEELISKPEIKKETKPEVKQEPKTEKITELNEEPKVEVKTEPPVEEKPIPVIEPKEEKISRIFLYRNFYVVYVGTL